VVRRESEMPRKAQRPDLYRRHYLDKGDDRTDLFRKLAARYDIHSALYPGSFVDISPSLAIEHVVYVDNYRKAKPFFSDPATLAYINAHKPIGHKLRSVCVCQVE